MPEFVHIFQSGRMNKDLDERLIPNGEYRDALNLDLANSERANVGVLQNVKGNVELRGKQQDELWQANYIEDLSNPVCIGSIADEANEKIYWFIASDNISAIAEYDQTTGFVSPVLIDANSILNFTKDYLITGINILDKFLFWTDNQTRPKKINIDKFKKGSYNFANHTKIPQWNPSVIDPNTSQYTQVTPATASGFNDFVEEDVTVAKLSPLAPPTLTMAESKFGNEIYGTGSRPVTTIFNHQNLFNFTFVEDTAGAPNTYQSYPTYGEWLENHASGTYLGSSFDDATNNPNYDSTFGWNGHVTITIIENDAFPLVWEVGNIIELNGEFDNDFGAVETYGLSLEITQINNLTVTGRIQAISSNIPRNINPDTDVSAPITWEITLLEDAPMFEYVFPRFGYRWKYIDNEYSTFSPFSTVAFIGGEFKYESSEGFNEGMTNNIRKLSIDSLTWGSDEVDELDIIYKESNSTAVYVVDTLKKKDYTPYNPNNPLPTSYTVETELITKIIESNQILRPWDNVPRKAGAQEIVGNRIVYANYLQNYTVSNTVKLNATLFSNTHPANLFSPEDPTGTVLPDPTSNRNLPKSSLKSIRTYQLGVVFKDKLGIETPVFTSKESGINVPLEQAKNVTALQASPTDTPPSFATHYKFFVKESSTEYYNLALDRFYEAEDGNVWLSFPSSERNKVDEETYLFLKKQHDNNIAVKTPVEYKILSISNEAPKYISSFATMVAGSTVTLNNEIEPGFLTIQFKGPTPDRNLQFGPNINSNAKITVTAGAVTTPLIGVRSVEITDIEDNNTQADYIVDLDEPLGVDIPSLDVDATIVVKVFEDRVDNKPEFEGRFFAKIKRDFNFDENIIASFGKMEEQFAVKDEIDFEGVIAPASGFPDSGYYYLDGGSKGDSRDGCSSVEERYFVLGHGWGGFGTHMDWERGDYDSIVYRPPMNGNNQFGFVYVNHGGTSSFIDRMLGSVMGEKNVAYTLNVFLSINARIRFKSLTGELSKVYTIRNTFARYTNRGARMKPGAFSGCEQRNGGFNKKVTVVIETTKPIQESWMLDSASPQNLATILPSIQVVEPITGFANEILSSNNPAIFETQPKESTDLNLFYEASKAIPIANYNKQNQLINWFNCFSFGNGVESNRVRDDFNAVTIDKGPKVSTVLDEPYAEERRGSGFIFSQIFNSTSGINRLNQFIQAEPITKDLNPIHGSIQKLHTRDTDLITLCEDKCFRVLANKDALFNADGNAQLTGNNAVLGQAVPYAGDYGISKNPESFASFAFRSYFTDKNRGTVIRLSRDGITDIGGKGMSDFYADNLRTSKKIIGLYDDDKDLYHLTLDTLSQDWQNKFSLSQEYQLNPDCNTNTREPVKETTVSFKESVDGWTSRKSFIPESGVSLNNIFYTFKGGRIYEHSLNATANNFYRTQHVSTFNVVVNEMPQVVKGFSTINYTGTRSRVLQYQKDSKQYSIAQVNAQQIIPIAVSEKQPGWYVNYVKTDLEGGEVKEFQKKEGKYFNFIRGLEIFNDCETSFDGIGNPDVIEFDLQDYNLTFTIDATCSAPNDTSPDATQFFFYEWWITKQDPSAKRQIINETTAQNAKCVIESFYNQLTSAFSANGYVSVTNQGSSFSYNSSDGLAVGTQMYLPGTTTAAAAGTYLFTTSGQAQSDVSISHAGLDPENPIAVHPSYYIMILGSDGKIASYTQYNTLTACAAPPEQNQRLTSAFNLVSASFNLDSYAESPNEDALLCNLRTWMSTYGNPVSNPGYGFRNIFWQSAAQGGSDTIQLSTQLYVTDNNGNYVTTGIQGTYIYYTPPIPPLTSGSTLYSGGLAPYVSGQSVPVGGSLTSVGVPWNGPASLIPSAYKIVRVNASGVVTHFKQINTLSPECT